MTEQCEHYLVKCEDQIIHLLESQRPFRRGWENFCLDFPISQIFNLIYKSKINHILSELATSKGANIRQSYKILISYNNIEFWNL